LTTFEDKLSRSAVGDEIVYHEGYHCMATTSYPRRNAEAQAAWDAHLRGEVLLYQRRIAPAKLEYCAKVVA